MNPSRKSAFVRRRDRTARELDSIPGKSTATGGEAEVEEGEVGGSATSTKNSERPSEDWKTRRENGGVEGSGKKFDTIVCKLGSEIINGSKGLTVKLFTKSTASRLLPPASGGRGSEKLVASGVVWLESQRTELDIIREWDGAGMDFGLIRGLRIELVVETKERGLQGEAGVRNVREGAKAMVRLGGRRDGIGKEGEGSSSGF